MGWIKKATFKQRVITVNESTNIHISQVGTRTVLAPNESLTHQNCEGLETAFNTYLTHQKPEIILDLSAVPFLDSEALELLLRMHGELRNRGSSLRIIGINPICRDILTVTRLINVFCVYANISEAINSGS